MHSFLSQEDNGGGVIFEIENADVIYGVNSFNFNPSERSIDGAFMDICSDTEKSPVYLDWIKKIIEPKWSECVHTVGVT